MSSVQEPVGEVLLPGFCRSGEKVLLAKSNTMVSFNSPPMP